MAFGDFTVVRASPKRVIGSSGLLVEYADNVPAFEFNPDGTFNALNAERGATNLCLRSRDLADAAWTKTDATAVRSATGADGVASTATTVTATAGNATVLQAITSASSARVFSAFVRRRTGTGTVEITQDNGSTWTAITLTSSFALFSTTFQTLTNPIVGFRVVTSGDEIDVDFCQAETGLTATSPIATEGSTVNRATDAFTLTSATSLLGQTEGTFYFEYSHIARGGATAFRWIQIAGSSNNIGLVTATIGAGIRTVVNGQIDSFGLVNPAVRNKMAFAYDGTGTVFFANGTQRTLTNGGAQTMTSLDSVLIQPNNSTSVGVVRLNALVLYKTRLSNSELIALTT
ncbi:MAG TPA: hypothetical protein VLA24_13845 [Pseudomonadales bacterium]|nr:hypothetical protein [Pseudomonadales bacterium]